MSNTMHSLIARLTSAAVALVILSACGVQRHGTLLAGSPSDDTRNSAISPHPGPGNSHPQHPAPPVVVSGNLTPPATPPPVVATPQVVASVAAVAFGTVPYGPSQRLPMTLTNDNAGAVTVTSISLMSPAFTFTGCGVGTILAPGASCGLSITLPANSFPSTFLDALVIAFDDLELISLPVSATVAPAVVRVLGDSYATASSCTGTYVGGYCNVPYSTHIAFKAPFTAPPVVHVGPARMTDQAGSIGYTMDSVIALASNVTTTGFTLTCSGSPNGIASTAGAYEGWFGYGSCSWLAIGAPGSAAIADDVNWSLRVFELTALTPDTCSGTYVGGLCVGGSYYRDITFDRPFAAPPKIIVSSRLMSDQGGSVGYATSKLTTYASNITTTGARIWCSGGQLGAAGDTYTGAGTIGSCDVTAIGDAGAYPTPSDLSTMTLQVSSTGNVEATACAGTLENSFCTAGFYVDVAFPKPFARPPTVIVTPAVNSTDGNAGMATDQVVAYASSVTATGFRMWCSGSPLGGPYDGLTSRASCNWTAIGSNE